MSSNRLPLSPNRPLVAAALTLGSTGSSSGAFDASAAREFYAIDLDIRNCKFPPVNFQRCPAVVSGPVRIRSAWLPGSYPGFLASSRTERLWTFLEYAATHLGMRSVVLPRRSEVTQGTYVGPDVQTRMAALTGQHVRVAIGIRAADGRQGHDQLIEFLNLRHAAEEWELDLALDLTGTVAPDFEAEAAVLRLLPRLTLVRMPSWVMANGDLAPSQAMARRVTATLAESGYRGMFSIVPSAPPLRLPWTMPSPSTAEEWTRTLIMSQYERRQSDVPRLPQSSSEIFRELF